MMVSRSLNIGFKGRSGCIKSQFSTNVQLSKCVHPHCLSIAPMMDYTNTHQRNLMRLITRRSVLYTEMVVCNTLLYRENRIRSLIADFSTEDPLVLQLGGSDPIAMHKATKIAVDYGYKEVNINVGCPSEKVSGAGAFGAVLMRTPGLVGDLALAVGNALGMAPTIKCRIGVDELDTYEHLRKFIETVSTTGGVTHFIIHARKAVLGGKFSPKQNRTVPPLQYSFVHRLVRDFPHIDFSLNGGMLTLRAVEEQLRLERGLVGVMVGRAAVSDPFKWRRADSVLYGAKRDPCLTRREILSQYALYARRVEATEGARCRHHLIKPLHGLFSGSKNGKKFRCSLGDNVRNRSMGMFDVIMNASECVGEEVLDYF